MSATQPTAEFTLPDALLERCRERAPLYDRENRFCQEDFDELKAAGYLRLPIPKEFGGYGMTLAEVGRQARKLALLGRCHGFLRSTLLVGSAGLDLYENQRLAMPRNAINFAAQSTRCLLGWSPVARHDFETVLDIPARREAFTART
jgi:alkylation response protein AidB-like acyl-CoA dehydrogenase